MRNDFPLLLDRFDGEAYSNFARKIFFALLPLIDRLSTLRFPIIYTSSRPKISERKSARQLANRERERRGKVKGRGGLVHFRRDCLFTATRLARYYSKARPSLYVEIRINPRGSLSK